MNITTAFLFIHLFGALVTAGIVLAAVSVVIEQKYGRYISVAKAMAAATLFQVLSGSVLSLVSAHESLFLFCGRMGMYFTIIGLLEMLLLARFPQPMRSQFPAQFVGGAFVISMMIVAVTGAVLFY